MSAYVMTYSSLFTDIQNTLNRETDAQLVSEIPILVSRAEFRCAREMKTLGFKRVVVTNFSPSSSVMPKPARWRNTISFNYGTGTSGNTFNQMYPREYEFCRMYWPDPTTTDSSQPPKFYADYDYNNWLIAPTPYTGSPVEISYYEKPCPLSTENQTNWLTDVVPDMLFYASLLEAEPYVKNFDLMQSWQQNYDRSLAALMGEDKKRRSDASLKRTEGE
jgi:hypothetical protein